MAVGIGFEPMIPKRYANFPSWWIKPDSPNLPKN